MMVQTPKSKLKLGSFILICTKYIQNILTDKTLKLKGNSGKDWEPRSFDPSYVNVRVRHQDKICPCPGQAFRRTLILDIQVK